MKHLSRPGLALACAGMEFSWIYALAVFIMYPILDGPYPLPQAVAAFAASATLTALLKGRGWRIALILLVHAAGLAFFMLRAAHYLFYRREVFWRLDWTADFLARSLSPAQFFFLFMILAWTLLLWIAGVRLALRPRSYLAVCTRMDLGFAAFFGILIIKLTLYTQFDVRSGEILSEYMMYSFFILALLSVALARNQSGARKVFLSGYRGIGLLLSFSLGLMFFGTGLTLVFLPYMKTASAAGYEALQAALKPLAPYVVALFRIIFMHGTRGAAGPSGKLADGGAASAVPGETAGWIDWLMNILSWGFLVMLGLMLAALVLIGLWYLLRWLLARRVADEAQMPLQHTLLAWLEKYIARLYTAWGWLRSLVGREDSAQVYTALLRWGRRSGMPRRPSETPLEYGNRLKRQFGAVAAEIDALVAFFNRYAYRDIPGGPDHTAAIRPALRKLQSPRLWPNRIKTRLLAFH